MGRLRPPQPPNDQRLGTRNPAPGPRSPPKGHPPQASPGPSWGPRGDRIPCAKSCSSVGAPEPPSQLAAAGPHADARGVPVPRAGRRPYVVKPAHLSCGFASANSSGSPHSRDAVNIKYLHSEHRCTWRVCGMRRRELNLLLSQRPGATSRCRLLNNQSLRCRREISP